MIYKACPGIILTSVCDSFFLVTPQSTIKMNDTAAFYWKCLKNGNTREGLKTAVLKEYEIEDESVLEKELDEFLDALVKENLLIRNKTEVNDGSEI